MFGLSKNQVKGSILIRDPDTEEIIVKKDNAIHFENMSITIARALAGRSDGHIAEMWFGSGASTTSGSGGISYFPPNVIGSTANLYNPTFFKIINPNNPNNTDPSRNRFEVRHTASTLFTDITIFALLDYNEPSGQSDLDNSVNNEGTFIFDELGLRAGNDVAGSGLLLTHVVFHPVQKALNRRIEIQYSIRIQMCSS